MDHYPCTPLGGLRHYHLPICIALSLSGVSLLITLLYLCAYVAQTGFVLCAAPEYKFFKKKKKRFHKGVHKTRFEGKLDDVSIS